MKDLPKARVSSSNRLKLLDQKKSKVPILPWRAKQRKHKTLKAKTDMDHVTRKKKTEANLEKAIRLKLLELCKTRSKKSSHDLFNFYVVLAGH